MRKITQTTVKTTTQAFAFIVANWKNTVVIIAVTGLVVSGGSISYAGFQCRKEAIMIRDAKDVLKEKK